MTAVWPLLGALALAHGDCPPTAALFDMARQGRIPAPLVHCIDGGELDTVEGRAKRWARVFLRVHAGALGPDGKVEARALLAMTTSVPAALDAAELLLELDPSLAAECAERARSVLEATPWSVQWVAWADRLRSFEVDRLQLDGRPIRPGGAAAAELAQCRDLGRLWARALLGGVYATDRDCVVRLAGTLEGAARTSAANLALALADRHANREEGQLVHARIEELTAELR